MNTRIILYAGYLKEKSMQPAMSNSDRSLLLDAIVCCDGTPVDSNLHYETNSILDEPFIKAYQLGGTSSTAGLRLLKRIVHPDQKQKQK